MKRKYTHLNSQYIEFTGARLPFYMVNTRLAPDLVKSSEDIVGWLLYKIGL